MEKEMIEEVMIVGGLVMVQFVYAGNSLLMSYLMSVGLGPFTIVIFSTFATFLILSPFAVLFERNQWPNELSWKLIGKLVLISFAGVTLFQSLFLEGIRLTSPAMATAMPNLAPGLIFFIAWIVRLERMNIRCYYSKLKILGTLLCVLGALTMSLMHSASISHNEEDNNASVVVFDRDKIVGCIYLLGAVFVLSTNVVLQASTLAEFPAPISLSAITALIGVLITTMVELLQNQNHKLLIRSSLVSISNLVGFSIVGGMVSGACVSFNGWAMKKRGPVMVSMFSPFATVISVGFSVFTLGEPVCIGSVGGMALMFIGVYLVLWAKGKEGFSQIESEFDTKDVAVALGCADRQMVPSSSRELVCDCPAAFSSPFAGWFPAVLLLPTRVAACSCMLFLCDARHVEPDLLAWALVGLSSLGRFLFVGLSPFVNS